jgi:hypothetical protein
MKRTILTFAVSVVLAGVAFAGIRATQNLDGSVLIQDDDYGIRLLSSQEYQSARDTALAWYGKINKGSQKRYGNNNENVATTLGQPTHVLSDSELYEIAHKFDRPWWVTDARMIAYRNLEAGQ